MKTFNSFGEMALELAGLEIGLYEELNRGLENVLKRIQAGARAQIGHYQPAVGGFPAWRELADETKQERVQQGFTENDPLERSGELRDAITHERDTQLQGVVGVQHGQIHSPYPDGYGGQTGGHTDVGDIAVDQELGTQRIPARPFLGPAAFLSREAIQKLVGAAAVAGIIGASEAKKIVGGTLAEEMGVVDYDFTTKD
jgi:phage gpG-like protein